MPLVYLNRVGGQDELVFDGSSFVTNDDGSIAVQMPDFEEAMELTDWVRTPNGWRCEPGERAALSPYPEDMYRAMMLALRDYVGANGFPGVILGLSGGIDSALSAAVAVDALGADKVWCVMLPSKYTSDDSLEDAAECARLLGVRHDVIPIVAGVGALDEMLAKAFEGESARPRGGEYPVAPPDGDADGAQQPLRPHAPDDRQQERDVGRLCDPLWRHGRRLFGA